MRLFAKVPHNICPGRYCTLTPAETKTHFIGNDGLNFSLNIIAIHSIKTMYIDRYFRDTLDPPQQ